MHFGLITSLVSDTFIFIGQILLHFLQLTHFSVSLFIVRILPNPRIPNLAPVGQSHLQNGRSIKTARIRKNVTIISEKNLVSFFSAILSTVLLALNISVINTTPKKR
jgi:hypothetical protein